MIVGLTGGIGSGKTTVAQLFMKFGIPVYDSDASAKKLMESSVSVKKAIIDLLGEKAYEDSKLNRPYIAEQIFNNKKTLRKLNNIVHPAVREDFLRWVKKQDAPYVLQESALIFENSNQEKFDKTILVTAPVETRIERVKIRDGVSREKVLARMKNQLKDIEKQELADFVIENIHAKKTEADVLSIHQKLLQLTRSRS